MILAVCSTNLDDYKMETWPEYFVALPREGDWVAAKSGKVLKVVKVTHKFGFSESSWLPLLIEKPYIKVELHKVV